MAKIMVEIVGDAKKFQSALGSAGRSTDRFGKQVGGSHRKLMAFGKVGAVAAVAGLAAVGKVLFDSVQVAAEHEKALAQTMAVIKSTGGSAKVSAGHILSLSDHIEKMSGIDDLATQAGENMLLTFTNIKNGVGAGNKIFDAATLATANLSTAMGKDMTSSAQLVGKALNDPIKGLTALTRVGVSFTAAQKESIKAMVEHGNTAGAQKIILGELTTEFGGSAKAAGGTMGGQLAILKAHFEDVEQVIGQKILPVLNQLIAWAIANWPTFELYARIAMQAISDAWDNVLKPAIDAIVTVIGTAVGAVKTHWDEISAIFTDAFKVITGFVDAFAALFTGDWDALWKAVKQIVTGQFDLIKDEIKLIGPILLKLMQKVGEKLLEGLKAGVEGLADLALEGLKALPQAFVDLHIILFNAAVALGGKILDGMKSVVKDIAGDVADFVGKIPGKLLELVGDLKSAAGKLGGAIVDGIGEGLGTLGATLARLLKAPINAVIDGWNNISFSIPGFDSHIPGVGKVGGQTISVPNVPRLAAGGIVTRPTLALIGERGPEAVMPLGRGGGRGVNITVNVQGWVGNDQALAEKLRSEFIRIDQRTGSLFGTRPRNGGVGGI
jgi:hypothetical protein